MKKLNEKKIGEFEELEKDWGTKCVNKSKEVYYVHASLPPPILGMRSTSKRTVPRFFPTSLNTPSRGIGEPFKRKQIKVKKD